MLKNLRLKFGETPGHPPLTVPVGSAIVIVGPNNSGKSKLLQELEYHFTKYPRLMDEYLILQDVEAELPRNPALQKTLLSAIQSELPQMAFAKPDKQPIDKNTALVNFFFEIGPKALELLEQGKLVLTPQLSLLPNKLTSLFTGFFSEPSWLIKLLTNKEQVEEKLTKEIKPHTEEFDQTLRDALQACIQLFKDLQDFSHAENPEQAILRTIEDGRIRLKPYLSLLASRTVHLDGRQRLNYVLPTRLPEEGMRSDNHLTRLLWNNDARQHLRKIVFEAFEYHLSIDTSSFRETRIKLSHESPEAYEHSHRPEALDYFHRAQDIERFSDGVKSFVGLLAALLSDEYLVMLIDEPEAFLHPPLARRLGQELHQLSHTRGAHVLAATHSADFLMGCLQASPDAHIVRLTYRQGVPTARLLSREQIQQMMQDPLLRSTGVLSALFHEGAVVCEGDRDRAFYQEINERLLTKSGRKEGADSCLFINAHSKQAIHRVIGLLRRMGIPAVAIIDLDIIIDENVLKELLTAIEADAALIETLGMAKGLFYRKFIEAAQGDSKKGRSLLKARGINALTESQKQAMKSTFLGPLSSLGIFIVPGGEVESWLAYLLPDNQRPDKQEWLTTIFDAIGSDPHSERYVWPKDGDVWNFMREIAQWIGDPKRQGMPA